jgi:hypothetical protein
MHAKKKRKGLQDLGSLLTWSGRSGCFASSKPTSQKRGT